MKQCKILKKVYNFEILDRFVSCYRSFLAMTLLVLLFLLKRITTYRHYILLLDSFANPMKRIFPVLILITVIAALTSPLAAQFSGKPQYEIEILRADTLMGKIIVEMFPAIAPNSVRNWESLVNIHFYDSTAFHRVIPDFMIQGGDPNSRSGPVSTWGYGDGTQATIDAEFSAVSHKRGILSAARASDPNSASSQFFICVGNPNSLDRKYSVYGRVVQGMDVADSIVSAARNSSDRPLVKISMFIKRLGSNDSLTATPKLVLPANNSSNGTAVKATLRWNKVSDAMMYHVEVATNIDFTNIIADTTRSQVDTFVIIPKLKGGTTYYWRVLANNGGNESQYSETWKFNVEKLDVTDAKSSGLELSEASPNPSKGNVTIHFNLKEQSSARIIILDILGREILRLIDSPSLSVGDHEVIIQSGALLPGMYIYRLESNGEVMSKRLIVE